MAHKKNTTNLTELLLQCVTQPDPMLSMLEWLCIELMEVEVDQQLGAEKSQRIVSDENGHRDIIAVESMAEESGSSYGVLFQNLEDRSLSTPRLIHFRCTRRTGFGNS